MNTTIRNEDNLQYYANLVSALIQLAHKRCYKTVNKNKAKRVPYWDNNCKETVKRRNKLYRKYIKNRTQDNIIEYKKAKAEAQKTIRNTQSQYWESYCNLLSETSKLGDVWKRAKAMVGKQSSSHILIIIHNSTTYITDAEKAEVFGNYISKTSSSSHFNKAFLRHKHKQQQKRSNITHSENTENEYINTSYLLHELSLL